ncbi:MAG: hypothetical protein AB7L84_09625 [Acidimicrobiia bacterium]
MSLTHEDPPLWHEDRPQGPGGGVARGRGRRWTPARLGHLVPNLVIVVVLAVLAVDNLPDSELKDAIRPAVRPVEDHLALRQNWALFAPNPPRRQGRLVARVEYEDGSTAVWELPSWEGPLGSYSGYRWRKWGESLMRSRNVARLEAAARTVGEFAERDDLEVRRVSLWRLTSTVQEGADPVSARTHLVTATMEEGS